MSFLDKLFKKKESVESAAKETVANAAKAADKAVDKGAAAVADLGEKVTHVLEKADLGELLPGAPSGGKINLAIYWAAACGGCDVSILDVNERILTVGDMANIVMWPVAADGKELSLIHI